MCYMYWCSEWRLGNAAACVSGMMYPEGLRYCLNDKNAGVQKREDVKANVEQWAKRAFGIAKSKHKEISNGKGLPDIDIQVLDNLKSKLTAAWSKESETGRQQAPLLGLVLISSTNAWLLAVTSGSRFESSIA